MADVTAEESILNEEEEVDDLFGDDEEAEVEDNKHAEEPKSDDEDEEDADSSQENEVKVLDIMLPRHSDLHKTEDVTYTLRMPVFLNIAAHPFDPVDFKETVQRNIKERMDSAMDAKAMENDLIAEKLLNENTIRWRYKNAGNDEIAKQSNAHFVQWDDGSISLKIGNEMFDIKDIPLYDNLLVKSHDAYEILQGDSILNKHINLLPSSTFTSTHRKLTQAVKNIQRKDKILNTITDTDPLLKQRLADENERKSLKMRRQMEMKRRLQEERLERNGSPSMGDEYETAYERFERTYGNNEYDDEDDFVANDEEDVEDDGVEEDEEDELDRAAERLRKVKEEGVSKYKSKSSDELEEQKNVNESEPEEGVSSLTPNHEGEVEDESKHARKKRRIIDSDEE